MESNQIREVVLLEGMVQGVGLRDRVLQIARGFHVAGSVRNLRNGSVEIDLEGPREEVDRFLDDLLANLPSFARVDRLKREPAAPRGATGFSREPTR